MDTLKFLTIQETAAAGLKEVPSLYQWVMNFNGSMSVAYKENKQKHERHLCYAHPKEELKKEFDELNGMISYDIDEFIDIEDCKKIYKIRGSSLFSMFSFYKSIKTGKIIVSDTFSVSKTPAGLTFISYAFKKTNKRVTEFAMTIRLSLGTTSVATDQSSFHPMEVCKRLEVYGKTSKYVFFRGRVVKIDDIVIDLKNPDNVPDCYAYAIEDFEPSEVNILLDRDEESMSDIGAVFYMKAGARQMVSTPQALVTPVGGKPSAPVSLPPPPAPPSPLPKAPQIPLPMPPTPPLPKTSHPLETAALSIKPITPPPSLQVGVTVPNGLPEWIEVRRNDADDAGSPVTVSNAGDFTPTIEPEFDSDTTIISSIRDLFNIASGYDLVIASSMIRFTQEGKLIVMYDSNTLNDAIQYCTNKPNPIPLILIHNAIMPNADDYFIIKTSYITKDGNVLTHKHLFASLYNIKIDKTMGSIVDFDKINVFMGEEFTPLIYNSPDIDQCWTGKKISAYSLVSMAEGNQGTKNTPTPLIGKKGQYGLF